MGTQPRLTESLRAARVTGPGPFLDIGFPQLLVQEPERQVSSSHGPGQRQTPGEETGREQGQTHLDSVLLVGDEVDAGLHPGVGALPEHVLLQLVDIWGAGGCLEPPWVAPLPPSRPRPRLPRAPSNLPEKLSVARHRFFFLLLFLASGMSMGWLVGMSGRAGHSRLKVVSPGWACSREKASSKGLCPCRGEGSAQAQAQSPPGRPHHDDPTLCPYGKRQSLALPDSEELGLKPAGEVPGASREEV